MLLAILMRHLLLQRHKDGWYCLYARFVWGACAVLLSGFVSFSVTAPGLLFWDDGYAKNRSDVWMAFIFENGKTPHSLYGSLWDIILGVAERFLFAFAEDPYWVRHALTYWLYIICLFVIYWGLRHNGLRTATAFFASSSIFGIIRLGGHALFNVKDVPAALLFTISTIFLYSSLHKLFLKRKLQPHGIVVAVLIALLPALVRLTLLLHVVMLFAFICTVLFLIPHQRRNFGVYLIIALLLITCVLTSFYPHLNTTPTTSFASSLFKNISLLSQYGEVGVHIDSVFFGKKLLTSDLPYWYYIIWVPIIIHPIVLATCVIGIALLCIRGTIKTHYFAIKFVICSKTACLRLSFYKWILLTTFMTLTAIIIKKPYLYDQERHILFLYPVILLALVLPLDRLRDRTLYLLSLIIIIASVISYFGWGRYSYVYTSPLSRSTLTNLGGDYWGLCLSHAARQIPKFIPWGTNIHTPYANEYLVQMQIARMENSKNIVYSPTVQHYILNAQKNRPYAVIAPKSRRTESTWNWISHATFRNGLEPREPTWSYIIPNEDRICLLEFFP